MAVGTLLVLLLSALNGLRIQSSRNKSKQFISNFILSSVAGSLLVHILRFGKVKIKLCIPWIHLLEIFIQDCIYDVFIPAILQFLKVRIPDMYTV